MLGIFVVFDHIDGEAVFTSRGEDIDAAGLHRWPGFVWMPASLTKCAGSAEPARSSPQAKGFVISREKNLPLHFGRDFLCIKASTLEQNGAFI